MFLRPAQLQKGEKALRNVDFLDNIVPQDEERTWVVGNTRTFYNLPSSNKLTMAHDVQNYFAYTIKIMKLSNR
ncbi:unnamed protein product [Pocillopora meandrina]|uniref:Uncharacterized protein n=1 Tax=Pocillopora meandrina TaxID=46732 RepID=A0AAU9W1A0_9CNID|nr:unnamed protein product [Pocillopora meandrina]